MEREPMRLREGYLVKKGSMFNTWKPMWVVLLEDGIEFYKRKADNSPKGMVPLKGSSINSPCHDFGKRMFVFKLTAAKQQDHFFQAAYLEERDAWVRDIKKAIHCIDGGQRFARKSTRRSIRLPETINLSALYLSMKDPEKGIKELKLEKDKKVFNHCFTGTCVIDWLVSSNSIRNRKEGLMLASSLLSEGYLQPAGDTSKAAAEGLSDTPFLDLSDAYYYFASCQASEVLEERLYRNGEIPVNCHSLHDTQNELAHFNICRQDIFFWHSSKCELSAEIKNVSVVGRLPAQQWK
ncbi:pleckstrin isoform X3 [Buteo buteo]|uniref:pleckstrin isoform X3 n=1 Tax=Buteo buteo TaxID=30397 RepID=UPI003EBDE402